MYQCRHPFFLYPFLILALLVINVGANAHTRSESYLIRFKVIQPVFKKLTVSTSGFRHEGDPWYFPQIDTEIGSGEWSDWIDLSGWKWHGKMRRAGGIAEFPSLKLSVSHSDTGKPVDGCEFEVQLAESPSEVQISFFEKGSTNSIVFLAPYPLKENKREFETGRQMAARQALWAKEAIGDSPINLEKFEIITALYSLYDPLIIDQNVSSLKSMGFNVISGIDYKVASKYGLKTVGKSWIYNADPDIATEQWNSVLRNSISKELESDEGREQYNSMAYFELSDEISGLDLKAADKTKLNAEFREYLREKRLGKTELGKSLEEIEFPSGEIANDALPDSLPVNENKILYHAAKFGQWWSAKQLKVTSELIRGTFPGMQTGTLLPSHGFLGNAWGPKYIGMSYQMMDWFELAEQGAVTQISTEDWMGLNHMYGPNYTWTGGQTFGYLNALNRSAIGNKPISMRTFLTVSDDKYLRLKAYSAIGQGVKSFYFWAYGPTSIGTENYWSDLKSEYIGIAKLNQTLENVENVVYPAKTVSDPVAILYSVSHDIWNNDKQSVFTERRLLWHGLRHLHIQPNFVREEDIDLGNLRDYKVLYITDWNISRSASEAIDKWIKGGGIAYLSAWAATKDEYNSPYSPAFARLIWDGQNRNAIAQQKSTYNERTDLRTLKPITTANVKLGDRGFEIPVLGLRSNMNREFETFAMFEDGTPAGKIIPYGLGKIVAVGFMPMLAYGQLANFQPTTLSEQWSPEPREIIAKPLKFAKIIPTAKANVPVVEVSYMEGKEGSALVLANYTYQNIENLLVTIQTKKKFTKVLSANGVDVSIIEQKDDHITIKMKLDWTDIVTLR